MCYIITHFESQWKRPVQRTTDQDTKISVHGSTGSMASMPRFKDSGPWPLAQKSQRNSVAQDSNGAPRQLKSNNQVCGRQKPSLAHILKHCLLATNQVSFGIRASKFDQRTKNTGCDMYCDLHFFTHGKGREPKFAGYLHRQSACRMCQIC